MSVPVSPTPFSLPKVSTTNVEEEISHLKTLCFGFKCLVDIPIDEPFFHSSDFYNWLGLFFMFYDSFHAHVNTLEHEYNSLCEDIKSLETELRKSDN